jgi:two-component system, OmpR family, response regulator
MNLLKEVNILAVEDDAMFREVLCEVFKLHGANVHSARNGQEALTILENNAIDLVISDIQMPIMDGKELLKKIRAKNSKVPIVLLATGQSLLTEKEALSLGAAGLITKPIGTRDLLDKVSSVIVHNSPTI